MMTNNPYLDEVERRYDFDDIDPRTLATLATAHELHEMNRLTAAANAPMRVVNNVQAPISPETLHAQKVTALPDDSSDARIAAAARRWAGDYENREVHSPGTGPTVYGLATRELFEAIRREDER